MSAGSWRETVSRRRPLDFGPNRAISPASRPVTPIPAKPAKNETETTAGSSRAPRAPPPWPIPSDRESPLARARVGKDSAV